MINTKNEFDRNKYKELWAVMPQSRNDFALMTLDVVRMALSTVRFVRQDQHDFEIDVFSYCLERFDRAMPKDPYLYFFQMARRKALEIIEAETIRRSRANNIGDCREHPTARIAVLEKPMQLLNAASAAKRKQRTPVELIDLEIKANRIALANLDGERRQWARVSLATLQEHRRRITGEYKPMRADGVAYSRTQRLELDFGD